MVFLREHTTLPSTLYAVQVHMDQTGMVHVAVLSWRRLAVMDATVVTRSGFILAMDTGLLVPKLYNFIGFLCCCYGGGGCCLDHRL